MNLLFAGFLFRGSPNDRYIIPLIFAIGIVMGSVSIAYNRWSLVTQWLDGIRGRHWQPVSAVIDVVTVAKQTMETPNGTQVIGYLSTLTYFYHNPELQMGEYSRMIDYEEDAHD